MICQALLAARAAAPYFAYARQVHTYISRCTSLSMQVGKQAGSLARLAALAWPAGGLDFHGRETSTRARWAGLARLMIYNEGGTRAADFPSRLARWLARPKVFQ